MAGITSRGEAITGLGVAFPKEKLRRCEMARSDELAAQAKSLALQASSEYEKERRIENETRAKREAEEKARQMAAIESAAKRARSGVDFEASALVDRQADIRERERRIEHWSYISSLLPAQDILPTCPDCGHHLSFWSEGEPPTPPEVLEFRRYQFTSPVPMVKLYCLNCRTSVRAEFRNPNFLLDLG
jgi:hypothetical protein